MNELKTQSFIDILESLIDAESSHSSACKNWLMTILTGFILLCKSSDTMPNFLYLLFPIMLFCYLDAYYLGKESWYRDIYRDFVNKAKDNNFSSAYVIEENSIIQNIKNAIIKLGSPSVLYFYLAIAIASYLLYYIFE